MPEKDKYCVQERVSNRYVETFIFNDTGVGIEFTRDMKKAAKVSMKALAEAVAQFVPSGRVRVWQDNKEKPKQERENASSASTILPEVSPPIHRVQPPEDGGVTQQAEG